jgi:hypothetical protein
MKKLLLPALLLAFCASAFAQTSGDTAERTRRAFAVALQPPIFRSKLYAQISSPYARAIIKYSSDPFTCDSSHEGWIYWNSTSHTDRQCNGTAWQIAAMGANVVSSVVNDTNVTGGIANNALTLGWTGTLGKARGGTGADLSATGGAHFFLRQNSAGGAIDVAQPSHADLSDYTEGTFTPTLTFGGGSTGITYTVQTGKYTRVGDWVFFRLTILLSSKGSSTGSAAIGGLPVAASSGTNDTEVAYMRLISVTYTGVPDAFVNPVVSTTALQIEVVNNGTQSLLTDTAFTNTTNIVVTGMYRTN